MTYSSEVARYQTIVEHLQAIDRDMRAIWNDDTKKEEWLRLNMVAFKLICQIEIDELFDLWSWASDVDDEGGIGAQVIFRNIKPT